MGRPVYRVGATVFPGRRLTVTHNPSSTKGPTVTPIPTAELVAHAVATLTAHRAAVADEQVTRTNRDDAIRALAAAGMTVPDIDRALNGALSRSLLRIILNHRIAS